MTRINHLLNSKAYDKNGNLVFSRRTDYTEAKKPVKWAAYLSKGGNDRKPLYSVAALANNTLRENKFRIVKSLTTSVSRII